ncbi:MAG: hypothetical protein DRN99_05205, partial [Thermoproteota archaeon]
MIGESTTQYALCCTSVDKSYNLLARREMVVQLTLDKTTLVLFSTAGSLVVLFLLAPLLLTAVTADYQLVASSVAKREVLEAFANTLVAA